MVNIREQLNHHAIELGFDLIRVTSAEPFVRDEQAATERVRDGLMDGLSWYTEERVHKANRPQELLQGAKSVISLAICYNSGAPKQTDTRPIGKIARYAWGDDYHDVIKKKLRELVTRLSEVCGQNIGSRVFVDDGPMNDRAAAARSGIGWFGKNTNILTPSHGSWVFLAQIVTDIEIEPDEPLKKTCGSCVSCIDACPTGAIVAPYVIDNTKCISYLTIELRGAIPRKLRPLVGDWIFGCDICQDVCPVNRKVSESIEPAFQKRHDFDTPQLVPLLALDDEAFRERFRKSPIKRTKRIGLQRNVCVALGNIGDDSAIPALAHALMNSESLVRSHAAWALGQIGGDGASNVLTSSKETEQDAEVLEEIELAIDHINASELL